MPSSVQVINHDNSHVDIATLKLKMETGETFIFKLSYNDTISDLRELVDRYPEYLIDTAAFDYHEDTGVTKTCMRLELHSQIESTKTQHQL